MERRALIFQITAKKLFQLNGTNPHTMTFGTDADIWNLCQFGWYEENILQAFLSRKSSLADASVRLKMKEMKWPSGC